jgi:Fic family protein
LPVHPVVTIARIVDLLTTSKPTAAKAVQILVKTGVLTETSGKQRDQTFAYKKYLTKLRAGTELEPR